jgi:hypothetical protein
VNNAINQELTDVFEAASEFVQPRPDLADRARRNVRRRRQRLRGAAAVCAALAVIAGSSYAAVSGQHHRTRPEQPVTRPRPLVTVDYQVTQLAVNGPYVYVLGGQNSLLTAYDRATGMLVRRVTLPANATALAVGPGGLVWVAFSSDQSGGPVGFWLLNPDLVMHSAAAGIVTYAIVPTSRNSAWVTGQHDLMRLQMPGPGQFGRASLRPMADTSLGSNAATRPGSWAGIVGSRDAVLVSAGGGYDARLVIAGEPRATYGGAPRTQVSAAASTGAALWVTTYAQHNGEASLEGPLVRLNSRLQPTTPPGITASTALNRSEAVWSDGGTVWVATGVQGHALVCLTASGARTGPIETVPVRGEVMALAATARTVYVYAQYPPGEYAPTPVTAYPVPAGCR